MQKVNDRSFWLAGLIGTLLAISSLLFAPSGAALANDVSGDNANAAYIGTGAYYYLIHFPDPLKLELK